MKIVQILIKSTDCQYWSTGILEKYWKPCLHHIYWPIERRLHTV